MGDDSSSAAEASAVAADVVASMGQDNVTAYFANPEHASGVGSLSDICQVWTLGISGEEPGWDQGALDSLRALMTLEDDQWAQFSTEIQDAAMTQYLTANC